MTRRGMPIAELKPGTWYYDVRCACGQQIVVTDDTANDCGDEFVELTAPIDVKCECGTVTNAKRFQKFKAT